MKSIRLAILRWANEPWWFEKPEPPVYVPPPPPPEPKKVLPCKKHESDPRKYGTQKRSVVVK